MHFLCDEGFEIEHVSIVGRDLVSHMGMGHAWVGSVDISINKAFTARVFDSPARSFYGVQGSNQGRMMILASGIPLRHDGQVLGAVDDAGAAESRIRRSPRRP
ncbi:heme-binding protein [Streptomyces sp. NPDC059916]|uniref:GlcG/HbpS family heme-binding protein n=1 Tax=Streptomyces sp. NPDC059916 TaxID=3347001 RepID=UPI0036A54970